MEEILILANTILQLRQVTNKELEIIKNSILKLNKDKCSFEQQKIDFLAHIINKKGITADREKKEAIQRKKTPIS